MAAKEDVNSSAVQVLRSLCDNVGNFTYASTGSLDHNRHMKHASKDFQFFYFILFFFMDVVQMASSSLDVSCTETKSIEAYFPKGIKVPMRNAKVIVSADKLFVISFFKSKQQVMLKCHYNFTNEYG